MEDIIKITYTVMELYDYYEQRQKKLKELEIDIEHLYDLSFSVEIFEEQIRIIHKRLKEKNKEYLIASNEQQIEIKEDIKFYKKDLEKLKKSIIDRITVNDTLKSKIEKKFADLLHEDINIELDDSLKELLSTI